MKLLNLDLQNEDKLIKQLVVCSLGAHALVWLLYGLDFSFRLLNLDVIPVAQSLPIEVDLLSEEQTQEELKVDRKILPQLPMHYEVEEKELKEEPDMSLSQEAEAKQIKEESLKKLKDKQAALVTKNDALARLLKEKARRDQKFQRDEPKLLSKNLAARKEELGQLLSNNFTQTYADVLRAWIHKYYKIPEVYHFQEADMAAILEIQIRADGELKDIKISKSSSNPLFDELAFKTLKEAAPFPKPPHDWIEKTITLPFRLAKK